MAVRPRIVPASKTCGRCAEEKDAAAFGRNLNMASGLQSWCRECAKARRRERYASESAYRVRVARRSRERYLANPDQVKARAREWATANPERRKEIANLSAARHPETRRIKEQRRRALRRAAFMEDVHPLVVLERDDGVCGICGGDVDPLDFHVDHIVPIARGGEHSYGNSQAAHPLCNVLKGDRLEDEVAA